MDKYHKDAPFADPVVRCDSCNKIVLAADLRKAGRCPHCGNRKVRNLQVFNEAEQAQMKEWGVDPAFLAQFEAAA
jgi:predicted RNA-binding Zn-ribbon protein involved in translation (DUF1610 family)